MHSTLGLLVDSVLNIHSKLDIPVPPLSPIPSPMRFPSPAPSTSSPSVKLDPWEVALNQCQEKEAAATAAATAKDRRDSHNG